MSDIFFEGLDISDDDGANVDASAGSSSAPAANGKLSREQRLARAFQNSKDTWRPEHGLTESGWYIGLDRHPFDTDARPVGKDGSSDSLSPSTERNKVSQLDVKVMEYNISRLYAKGQYRDCLDHCLNYFRLEGAESSNGNTSHYGEKREAADSDSLPPYNDVDEQDCQLPVMSNTYKEVLDVALRCAAALGDRKWARRLAGASRLLWTTSNNAALTEAASKALLAAGDLPDAALAIFHSIADRGLLLPYVRILNQILAGFETQLDFGQDEPTSSKQHRRQLLELLRAIEDSLRGATPETPSLEFDDQEAVLDSTIASLHLPTDHRALVSDVMVKVAKARAVMLHPKQARDEDGEANVGRSVRTL